MDLCVFEPYIHVCIGMNLHSVLGLHKTIMLASCVLARNIQLNQEGVGKKMKFVELLFVMLNIMESLIFKLKSVVLVQKSVKNKNL